MVKKQSTERSEQLAGAIAAALAKFAKMIKADDILFQKYEERYFTKDIDQILDDQLYDLEGGAVIEGSAPADTDIYE